MRLTLDALTAKGEGFAWKSMNQNTKGGMMMTQSLHEALYKLRQLDEAEDVVLLDHLQAIENVKQKIDSYRYVIEQLSLQEEYNKKKASDHDLLAKRYKQMAARCEERLLWNLQQDGSNEIRGNDSVVRIFKSIQVKMKRDIPADDDFVKYHDYIKYSWKWDIKKIKSELKAGSANAQEVAELISCDNLKWSYNNGTTGE